MKINTIKCVFRELFRFSLTNEISDSSIFSSLKEKELVEIYSFLCTKKMGHLFYPYFFKAKLQLPEKIEKEFKRASDTKLLNFLKQESAITMIDKTLDSISLPHIFVKGGETRTLFKVPTFRVSNDLDILFEGQKNVDKAKDILLKECKGEEDIDGEVHDSIFILSKSVHVELHKALFSDNSAKESYDVFNHPFSNATVDSKHPSRLHLNTSYFYAYLVAHLAKHIKSGEAWLPPLMDIYTIRHLKELNYEQSLSYLKEAKLDKFEPILSSLLTKYMNNEKLNVEEDKLENYILRNEEENYLLVNKLKHGSKKEFIKSRLWLPLKTMQVIYPSLKKVPFLLPLYEVRRWFRALFEGKLSKSLKRVDNFTKLDENEISETNDLFNDIGL